MKPEEIKEFLEQHHAILAKLEPVEDQLGDAVYRAAMRYIVITRRYSRHARLPRDLACHWDWSIRDNEVVVTWEEHWSYDYGGHNEGTFTFDVALLFDEEKFAELEATLAARKEAATQKAEEKKRVARYLQYEKLKAEFGEGEESR